VTAYYDLPELKSLAEVRNKAQEEKTLAVRGNSIGGVCVWRPWFQRMDIVQWTDHDGNSYLCRIEGMDLDLSQTTEPFQHVQLDLTPLAICDPETDASPIIDASSFIAQDDFDRTAVVAGWGSAIIGGAWTLVGTADDFTTDGTLAKITLNTAGSIRIGVLASTNSNAGMYLKVSVKLTARSTAGWIHYGIVFRYVDSSNYYSVVIRVQHDGTTRIFIYKKVAGVETELYGEVITGMTISSSSTVNLRVWVGGTAPCSIAAKTWKSADSEPDTWEHTASDSTAALQVASDVGLRGYAASTFVAGGPITFDDFEVTTASSVAP